MKFLIFYIAIMAISAIGLICRMCDVEEESPCYIDEFECYIGDGCETKETCQLYKNYLNK